MKTSDALIPWLCALGLAVLPLAAAAADIKASLAWSDIHIVSIPIDGLVTEVQAEPGQRVSRGQTLIRFSQDVPGFNVRKARATMFAVEAELKEAFREKQDAEALYEQTVLSDVELQTAMRMYEQVRSRYERAQAELDNAKWAMGWTHIKSPKDAYVIESRVSPGQMIAGDVRSQPLMKLAAADSMTAVAMISMAQLMAIDIGDKLSVRANGKEHQGRVVRLSPAADANEYELAVQFEPAAKMVAGMAATLVLP